MKTAKDTKINSLNEKVGNNVGIPDYSKIVLDIDFLWEPVLVNDGEEYHFPMKISPFMREEYKNPVVYRWNIYCAFPDDNKQIYIGEADTLCPRRLQGYLTPGPSQETNKRLNAEFQSLIKKGLKIRIEILRIKDFSLNDATLDSSALANKHTRKFLEELLISKYQAEGYKLLNR